MRDQFSEKIVVLRRLGIGDCIVTTPTLRALRRAYPHAHITLVGDPYSSEVFQNSPDVDRVVPLAAGSVTSPAYLNPLLQLRRERFDLLIDMHSSARNCVQALLIGAKRRIGFHSRPLRDRVYTDLVNLPEDKSIHIVLRQAEVLKPLGLSLEPEDRSLRLVLTEDEKDAARRLLQEAGLLPGQPYIVLQATTGREARTFYQQWPPGCFAALADLMQHKLGLGIVIMASGDTRAAVEEIREKAALPILNLAGKTSVRSMMAVIGRASLYVGYDSGPMHVAAALGIGIAAFFDVPLKLTAWHPWTQTPYHLIRPGPRCAGCVRPECNLERDWCLQTLTVASVMDAVEEVHQTMLRRG